MRGSNYRRSYLPPFSADLAKLKYTRDSFKLDFLRNEALREKENVFYVFDLVFHVKSSKFY